MLSTVPLTYGEYFLASATFVLGFLQDWDKCFSLLIFEVSQDVEKPNTLNLILFY